MQQVNGKARNRKHRFWDLKSLSYSLEKWHQWITCCTDRRGWTKQCRLRDDFVLLMDVLLNEFMKSVMRLRWPGLRLQTIWNRVII